MRREFLVLKLWWRSTSRCCVYQVSVRILKARTYSRAGSQAARQPGSQADRQPGRQTAMAAMAGSYGRQVARQPWQAGSQAAMAGR